MKIIHARNVHEALPEAVSLMTREGRPATSRNGEVLVVPEPVTTIYERPCERVLFWPERDANPFFHFYEALWMLGGRDDVTSLTRFVKRMTQFSDDGLRFHGAYGHRWWKHFDLAQPLLIGQALREDHTDRRQVLQIWDVCVDLPEQAGKADIPCNLVLHFQVRDEQALDMTIFCRSNDIVWGCYGANAVHFSMLQEFIAYVAGVNVGRYYQISDNWHTYPETFAKISMLGAQRREPPDIGPLNPYESAVQPFHMINTDASTWLADLNMFLDEEHKAIGYKDRFFRHVALPMMDTHNCYKDVLNPVRFEHALEAAEAIRASDWRRAAIEWIQRRRDRRKKK